VGTAWLLAQLGRYDAGTVVQECGAGLLPIVVTAGGATLTGGTPTQSEPHDEGAFLAAIGLAASAYAGTPVRVCGCGLGWAYLQVHDDAVTAVEVDLGALARLPGSGLCVYSWVDGRAHSRCFAAGVGVPEDPATGSAALGLGVHLVASGLLPGDGESSYEIRQGAEIGRPSLLSGAVRAEGGRAAQVRVTGGVAQVATGQIAVP
jgi:trans-2,3-dihydro-3-hydroxyanthranilate isomerase